MQFERGAPSGRSGWVVDKLPRELAPPEHRARYPERPPVPADEGHQHFAEEPGGLRLSELYRPNRLPVPSGLDNALTRGAQVACPVDISKCADQPAPAVDLDHRHRRRAQ